MSDRLPPSVSRLLPALGAIATGLMLGVSYNYAGLYPVTWVALVPLLLAVHGRGAAAHYGLGLLAGLAMFLVAAPWMIEFLQYLKAYTLLPALAGAILFWLVSAQLLALLMLTYRWFQHFVGHYALWAFPVLAMVFYGWFPGIFPLQLGESQSAFLPAIQGAALTGVHGLDLMIGISNVLVTAGVLYGLRREPALASRGAASASVAGVVALAVWLGYGWWALDHWDRQVAQWPTLTVGLVQPNEMPSASVPDPDPGYAQAWPREMELSSELVAAGAEVILWPETRYKGYFEVEHLPAAYQRNVAALGVPLVFQDAEQHGEGEAFQEYNSALFLNAGGELTGRYRKHRLVAFGETLPLSRQFPWLVEWTTDYLGDFFSNLTPGSERATFPVNGVHLVPTICYESAFPGHVARSVVAAPESPLLVVLSNNGWFGDSREPWQHAGATVLRAVENRVSLVHVINNGPSNVVAPTGRLLASTPFRRQAGLALEVPYTPPGSMFSSWFTRWPEWFAVTSTVLLLIAAIWFRLRRRRRQ